MVIIIKWLPQCDELIVSMRAGRGESLSPATAAAGGFLHELGTGRYRGVKSSCPMAPVLAGTDYPALVLQTAPAITKVEPKSALVKYSFLWFAGPRLSVLKTQSRYDGKRM